MIKPFKCVYRLKGTPCDQSKLQWEPGFSQKFVF